MKYCKACRRMVYPRKKFYFSLFLFLAITTCGIGSIAYLLIFIMMKGSRCPICGGPTR